MRERLEALLGKVAERAGLSDAVVARVRVLFVPALDDKDALAGRWLARVCQACGARASFASPHALASEVVEQVQADVPDGVCIGALTAAKASERTVEGGELTLRAVNGHTTELHLALQCRNGGVLRIRVRDELERFKRFLEAR